MAINVFDGMGKLIFSGDSDEWAREEIRRKFKYAYSYTLPLWRILFYSRASNYNYWLKQVNKRLSK